MTTIGKALDPSVAQFGLELRCPWAELILEGTKTIETRYYPCPASLLGHRIAIIETPVDGKAGVSGLKDECEAGVARVTGYVIFEQSKVYSSREAWIADYAKHCVPKDSPYGWRDEEGGAVFAWVVKHIERVTPSPTPFMTRAKRSLFAMWSDYQGQPVS